VKIDLLFFEPGPSPWPDCVMPLAEQWSAVLSCTPTGERMESCAFVDGLWYGFVPIGGATMESRKLPAPGSLELVWDARGRLVTWDVQGDRQAFRDVIGNALLEAGCRNADVKLSLRERTERGADAEGSVARSLAGALEWELHKPGKEWTWKIGTAPQATLRYLQTAASAALEATATGGATEVTLAITGRVSQGPDETAVAATAVFDPKLGRVVSGRYETHTTSTSVQVSWHTRTLVMLSPWAEGQPTTPSVPPDPTLP
jgi:hypothetical protein